MSLKRSLEGRVLRLTLSRPERKNALNQELAESLVEACQEPVSAILIDAEGDVFSAGMDLDEATVRATRTHQRLFSLGATVTKPIVCAVQGPALGGGLGLVANAHIAIAAHGAQFGLTEIRVGMWPFAIWPSVVDAIGERRARMLALTGRVFGSREAVEWGLIHEAVPAIELDDRATAIAHQLADSSRTAISAGLGYIRDAREMPLEEALRLALLTREDVFHSADFAEGIAAFREKRKPRWPSLEERGA